MNTQHTPGPWRADYNCTSLITGIVDGEEVEVAHVDDRNDARLIAAAPELLAALELVERYLVERGVEFKGFTGRTIVLPAIRSAIAKAKGGEES